MQPSTPKAVTMRARRRERTHGLEGALHLGVAGLDAVDELGVLGGGAGRRRLGLQGLVGDPDAGGGGPQGGLVEVGQAGHDRRRPGPGW